MYKEFDEMLEIRETVKELQVDSYDASHFSKEAFGHSTNYHVFLDTKEDDNIDGQFQETLYRYSMKKEDRLHQNPSYGFIVQVGRDRPI